MMGDTEQILYPPFTRRARHLTLTFALQLVEEVPHSGVLLGTAGLGALAPMHHLVDDDFEYVGAVEESVGHVGEMLVEPCHAPGETGRPLLLHAAVLRHARGHRRVPGLGKRLQQLLTERLATRSVAEFEAGQTAEMSATTRADTVVSSSDMRRLSYERGTKS